MNSRNEFSNYIQELLSPLGDIQLGKFFGGTALRCDGIQFCMIMKNRLYFRVSKNNLASYLNYDSHPFSYLTKKGRVNVKSYYEVPADILDDQECLLSWAQQAVTASQSK
ncbi:TfoX/Sxy family protein [Kiloniella antarctica]|uniref:TfoX/Sxy family protein n=1 Tax=Kiloniella antarctica TaxID=1550907 RepID=A0ABW5BN68_9PROT